MSDNMITVNHQWHTIEVDCDAFIESRTKPETKWNEAFEKFQEAGRGSYSHPSFTFQRFIELLELLDFQVSSGCYGDGDVSQPWTDPSFDADFEFALLEVDGEGLVAVCENNAITFYEDIAGDHWHDQVEIHTEREDGVWYTGVWYTITDSGLESSDSYTHYDPDTFIEAWNDPEDLDYDQPLPTDSKHVYWVEGNESVDDGVYFEGKPLRFLI